MSIRSYWLTHKREQPEEKSLTIWQAKGLRLDHLRHDLGARCPERKPGQSDKSYRRTLLRRIKNIVVTLQRILAMPENGTLDMAFYTAQIERIGELLGLERLLSPGMTKQEPYDHWLKRMRDKCIHHVGG